MTQLIRNSQPLVLNSCLQCHHKCRHSLKTENKDDGVRGEEGEWGRDGEGGVGGQVGGGGNMKGRGGRLEYGVGGQVGGGQYEWGGGQVRNMVRKNDKRE